MRKIKEDPNKIIPTIDDYILFSNLKINEISTNLLSDHSIKFNMDDIIKNKLNDIHPLRYILQTVNNKIILDNELYNIYKNEGLDKVIDIYLYLTYYKLLQEKNNGINKVNEYLINWYKSRNRYKCLLCDTDNNLELTYIDNNINRLLSNKYLICKDCLNNGKNKLNTTINKFYRITLNNTDIFDINIEICKPLNKDNKVIVNSELNDIIFNNINIMLQYNIFDTSEELCIWLFKILEHDLKLNGLKSISFKKIDKAHYEFKITSEQMDKYPQYSLNDIIDIYGVKNEIKN